MKLHIFTHTAAAQTLLLCSVPLCSPGKHSEEEDEVAHPVCCLSKNVC